MNSRLKKISLLSLLTFVFATGFSFSNSDTSSQDIPFRSYKDSVYLDSNQSIIQLADTLYKSLIKKKREYILDNTPTWDAYQSFLDSAAKEKYSESTFRFKFLMFKSGLKKQFKRVFKDAKELEINFRRSKPLHYFLEIGIDKEYEREFCYLNLEMKRGEKDLIRVRILLLKMDNQWFFADDLALMVVKIERKRK